MYLLDTNIISEFVKKKPNKNLIGKVEAVPSASLYTASICVMELRYGALRTPGRADLWGNIEQRIISKLTILDFAYREAVKAAEVLRDLHAAGEPIGIEDVMISAIALTNSLVVVSANTKHFSRIADLQLENWLI